MVEYCIGYLAHPFEKTDRLPLQMRSFKHVTGVSPHQYVLNARIERAKSLLLRGNLSVAEVAHKVGFFDQSPR
jgi:AraC-like DNA-binding protein